MASQGPNFCVHISKVFLYPMSLYPKFAVLAICQNHSCTQVMPSLIPSVTHESANLLTCTAIQVMQNPKYNGKPIVWTSTMIRHQLRSIRLVIVLLGMCACMAVQDAHYMPGVTCITLLYAMQLLVLNIHLLDLPAACYHSVSLHEFQ